MSFADCFGQLQSEKKLDRDRGKKKFELYLKDAKNSEICEIIELIRQDLRKTMKSSWKQSFALLFSLKEIIISRKELIKIDVFLELALIHLENFEFRVRIESGEVIEHLSQIDPILVFQTAFPIIRDLINLHRVRDIENSTDTIKFASNETEKLFHDTSGWKYLETSMKALQCLIKGCRFNISQSSLDEIIKLLVECSTHTNRFVRETVMNVFTCILETLKNCKLENDQLIDCLIHGLKDNWSQVRLAASVAARTFVSIVGVEKARTFNKLLPAICINRHYLAEGVKLYNTKTWELISNGQGKNIVKKYIDSFIDFYISQAYANNHAVREAACHCLTELSIVLGNSLTNTHFKLIYDCLILCFKDESWPVRDTACLAIGIMVSRNPDFFSDKLEVLFSFIFQNLVDSIQSVRTGAAATLSHILNSLPLQTIPILRNFINENILKVSDQKDDYNLSLGMSKKPAKFGVVENVLDTSHVEQVMYSCGSLAPKMKSGLASGGCSGHRFIRPSHPWEITEGCLILLGEISKFFTGNASLSVVPSLPDLIPRSDSKDLARELVNQNLMNLSKILSYRSFKNYWQLHQSFLNYLISIIELLNIDNSQINDLKIFIEPLYHDLTQVKNQNLHSSTQTLIDQLSSKFGSKSVKNLFENHSQTLPL